PSAYPLLFRSAGGAGGDVERDHAEVAEARLDVAPLVVEVRPAQHRAHLVRLAPGVDRHAAVALLGGGVAVEAVVAVRAEAGIGQLVFLRLGLLQADHVGVLLAQPVEETLAGGRADAVGVEADDAHGGRAGKTGRQPNQSRPVALPPRPPESAGPRRGR